MILLYENFLLLLLMFHCFHFKVMSPIEWYPLNVKLSGRRMPQRKSSDAVREYQKLYMEHVEDKLIQRSDLVIFNSKEKLDVVALRNKLSSKERFKLLRPMLTPLNMIRSTFHSEDRNNSTNRMIYSASSHENRKNIVFVGTGNVEVDYQALIWFDRVLVQWINDGIPGIKVDVIGKNWYRVKQDINNKEYFRFLGPHKDVYHLARMFNNYIAVVFPTIVGFLGVNPYAPYAMEQGLPLVLTIKAAEGLCDQCKELTVRNPMDPFADKTDYPFLVSNINENYNFVEKIKLLKYEKDSWEFYSQLALNYTMYTRWFSRYQGALDLDDHIHCTFSKTKDEN